MSRIRLLFNPNSGRARAEGITPERIYQEFRRHGIVDIAELQMEGVDGVPHAVAEIEPDTLLVIAGGDGTIYEAVQSPVCREMRVAIIPVGTANNLATSAGIPQEIHHAVDVAVHGEEKRIDLGMANNRIFTQAAGVGFHARAFHLYGKRKDRSIVDASRAFLGAVSSWQPHELKIAIDGDIHEYKAFQVTVANTPVYGREIWIAPDAMIDDGLLDLVIVTGCFPRRELMRCIVNLTEGRGLDMSKVIRVTAKRIEITPQSAADIPVHADAEPIGFAPVTIEVLPSCLMLMVPR